MPAHLKCSKGDHFRGTTAGMWSHAPNASAPLTAWLECISICLKGIQFTSSKTPLWSQSKHSTRRCLFQKSHSDLHEVANGDTASSGVSHYLFTWHEPFGTWKGQWICTFIAHLATVPQFLTVAISTASFPSFNHDGLQIHEVWIFLSLEPYKPTVTAEDTN